MITVAKSDKVWLQLTRTEANALMVMLDNEMDSWHDYGIDFREWETLDLEAYKLLAFRTFKKWYMENCDD